MVAHPKGPGFLEAHSRTITLADGALVRVRPIARSDRPLLIQGFERLSEESRAARFLRPITRLSEAEIDYLVDVDYFDHFAWVALTEGEPVTGIGVSRYVRDTEMPHIAEAAVTVADEWQGRGIGTVLLELLALTAAGNGVTEFRAYIGQDNDPAKSLLANLGAVGHNEEGLWVVEVGLPLPSSPIRDTALHQVLVAVARGELDIEQRS